MKKGISCRSWLLASVCAWGLSSSGCSAGYLLHLGVGQARILWGRQPVGEVFERGEVAQPVKEKLELVLEAKRFGETDLGLSPSENYTYYYEVKGPAVAYNLTACPALALEPYRWCFPFAGCLPYKGFFDRDRAVAEMRRMSEGGYDTHLRSVAAYSTLGWFLDPVFSTMLRYEEADLVEIILHEMLHRTVFVKDQVAFNEGLATFVAERGTWAFFQKRRAEGERILERLDAQSMDRERFQAIVQVLAERLRSLYGSSIDESAKLREKEGIFEEARQSLKNQIAAFHEPGYARLLDQSWNNAFVASYLTYHQDLDVFDALLERLGGDLKALVGWAKGLDDEGEKDPFGRIRRRLERGENGSD